MDRQDRLGLGGDLRLDGGGVEIVALRQAVDEDRLCADAPDAAGGGEEGVAGADHLVSRADPQRHQGEQDRVGAGRDGQGVPRAQVGGAFPFQGLDLRPHDEVAAGQDPLEGGAQPLRDRGGLAGQVEEGDAHFLRIRAAISRTALSKPTERARATMEWPMFRVWRCGTAFRNGVTFV